MIIEHIEEPKIGELPKQSEKESLLTPEQERVVRLAKNAIIIFTKNGWISNNLKRRRPGPNQDGKIKIDGEREFSVHQGMLPQPLIELLASGFIKTGAELLAAINTYQKFAPDSDPFKNLNVDYLKDLDEQQIQAWIESKEDTAKNIGIRHRWLHANDNYIDQAEILLGEAGVEGLSPLSFIGQLTKQQLIELASMRSDMHELANIWDAKELLRYIEEVLPSKPRIFASLVKAHEDWRTDKFPKIQAGARSGDKNLQLDTEVKQEITRYMRAGLNDFIFRNTFEFSAATASQKPISLDRAIESLRDKFHMSQEPVTTGVEQNYIWKYSAQETFLTMVEILRILVEFLENPKAFLERQAGDSRDFKTLDKIILAGERIKDNGEEMSDQEISILLRKKVFTEENLNNINTAVNNLIYNIKADLNTYVIDAIVTSDIAIKDRDVARDGRIQRVDYVQVNPDHTIEIIDENLLDRMKQSVLLYRNTKGSNSRSQNENKSEMEKKDRGSSIEILKEFETENKNVDAFIKEKFLYDPSSISGLHQSLETRFDLQNKSSREVKGIQSSLLKWQQHLISTSVKLDSSLEAALVSKIKALEIYLFRS